MGWPYTMQTLTREQKTMRRETIDNYTMIAQICVVAPVLLFALYSVIRSLCCGNLVKLSDEKGIYDPLPSSPTLKKSRVSGRGQWKARLARLRWWMGSEIRFVGIEWGCWDQWVLGVVWGGCMLCLSVMGTGDDYLHLTKRLGSIAMSQFPFQYLLSLKSISPLTILFHSSHERLNRFHRVLGRIIYLLLALHGTLYLNYFIATSNASKLYSTVVLAGITCLFLLSLLVFTSLASVRAYSYRLFFVAHLTAAFGVPIILFLHAAKHIWFFALEALFVFTLDLVARKLDTFTSTASLERLPGGAGLVKIVMPVPEDRSERFISPGQHVYLSLPPGSRPHDLKNGLLFEFLFNPFTISSYSADSGELVLIARTRKGPLTRQLASLAQDNHGSSSIGSNRGGSSQTSSKVTGIKLNIEGPYGGLASKLADIFRADRILLVAGGVGATFILPLYAALKSTQQQEQQQDTQRYDGRVRLVWAVRHASDATWAVLPNTSSDDISMTTRATDEAGFDQHSSSSSSSPIPPAPPRKSFLDDPDVELYLTGNLLSSRSQEAGMDSDTSSRDGGQNMGMEMSMLGGEGKKYNKNHAIADITTATTIGSSSRRPSLSKIVGDTFRLGGEETVAVVVCGPRGMGRDVRKAVDTWVWRGRDVVWYEEAFGA